MVTGNRKLKDNTEFELQGFLAACLAASRVNPPVLEVPDELTSSQRFHFVKGWESAWASSGQPWDAVMQIFNVPQ